MTVGRWLRRLVWFGLLLAALLACKKKSEPTPPSVPTESAHMKRFKELTPQVKTLLGKLPAMAAKAKSEPAVKKEKPLTEKVDKAKFVIVGDQWLSDTRRSAGEDEVDLGDSTLSLCAYAVDKDPMKTTDTDLTSSVGYMESCLAWEYVAVARPRRVTLAKVNLASKTFEPGEVQGDLLVFTISTGEIAARYHFRTTNSDKLTWFEGKPEKEWGDEARRDLAQNLQGVIQERFAQERDTMGK